MHDEPPGVSIALIGFAVRGNPPWGQIWLLTWDSTSLIPMISCLIDSRNRHSSA